METLTISSFFEAAGQTVTGLVSGAGDFVTTLYATNAIGSIIVTLGVASAIIGLGMTLFLRKRKAR